MTKNILQKTNFSSTAISAAVIITLLRNKYEDISILTTGIQLLSANDRKSLVKAVLTKIKTTCTFDKTSKQYSPDVLLKKCEGKLKRWIIQNEGHHRYAPEGLDDCDPMEGITINGFKLFVETGKYLILLLKEIISANRPDGQTALIQNELCQIFGLDEIDMYLLKFAYAYDCDRFDFQDAIKAASGSSWSGFAKIITHVLGISEQQIKKTFKKESRLYRCGIIKCIPYYGSLRNTDFDINGDIRDYIEGLSGKESLLSGFVTIDTNPVLPLEGFGIEENTVSIITKILREGSSCNILLYGDPGTGKTEFARALAASAQKRSLFVNYQNEDSKNKDERRISLIAAQNIASDNDVIIADEADQMLNTTSFYYETPVEKGWLNDFLDKSQKKIIWITNRTSGIEESHRRRFTYSLKFEKFTSLQRENIWNQIAKKSIICKSLCGDKIEYLSENYQVNSAGIANAVTITEKLYLKHEITQEQILPTIETILAPHEELISGVKKRKEYTDIVQQYNPDAVNMDYPQERILSSLARAADVLKKTNLNTPANVNILLYGIPGTGKTEFVKYLAQHIGMKLIIKRCSDLESMYVGETEKNIAQAFKEAENSGRILFIDEADTFFTERSGANRSWEVSRTNEMLTQMENFRGIFICCTNMKDLLDQAAIRRFGFKVKFSALKKEQRIKLYERYFPGHGTLSEQQTHIIESLENLTPGDIRAVYNAFRYSCPSEITHDEIVRELQQEIRHKEKENKTVVGF